MPAGAAEDALVDFGETNAAGKDRQAHRNRHGQSGVERRAQYVGRYLAGLFLG